MAIDTSIYSNLKVPTVDTTSPLQTAQTMMYLSDLGTKQQAQMLQMRQAQMGMMQNQAVKQAFVDNTDPQSGQLNRQGFLSQLGSNPLTASSAIDYSQKFAANDKAQAEAQSAHADALGKIAVQTLPSLEYLNDAPDDQKPTLYHTIMNNLSDQGIPMHKVPAEFDQNWLDQTMGVLKNTPAYLAQQGTQATTSKTQADTQEALAKAAESEENTTEAQTKFPYTLGAEKFKAAQAVAALNADLYGSRSPDVALSNQYDKQAQPIRNSQVAMQQMIDNYNNPSPQGYASLKLNAFKIKFPNAPDVNSLEELGSAQGVTDKMKAWINQNAAGTDQGTMDNLMRDAISTFRANHTSLQGIQSRFQARAKQQNIDDPTIIAEPAIEQTYSNAMALQKKLGPYVPPTQRGIIGSVGDFASKIMGSGGGQSAQTQSPSAPKAGAGDLVMVKGRFYRVGPDGDSLIPNKGKN